MPYDTAQTIRSIDLFRDVPDTVAEEFGRGSFIQNFPPDVTLFWQGKTVAFLQLVISGHVELSAYYNSAQYTPLIVSAGAVLPVGSLAPDGISPVTARTISRCRVAMAPWALVSLLLEREPAFARALLASSAQLGRQLMTQLHDRALKRPYERLASWILAHVAGGPEEQSFELPYHKRLLAASLGMSLATLSRDLEALAPSGVTIENRTVRVRSLKALENVVAQAPCSGPEASPI